VETGSREVVISIIKMMETHNVSRATIKSTLNKMIAAGVAKTTNRGAGGTLITFINPLILQKEKIHN
jgi:DeoR/GlpR family transcriptional regulator of sugar metabolism